MGFQMMSRGTFGSFMPVLFKFQEEKYFLTQFVQFRYRCSVRNFIPLVPLILKILQIGLKT